LKLEQESTVEAALSGEIDVLDDGGLTRQDFARAPGATLVLAVGRLAVEEQPEQSSRLSSPASGTFCSSMKASAVSVKPSARRRVTIGWVSIVGSPLDGSIRGRNCSRGSRAAAPPRRRPKPQGFRCFATAAEGGRYGLT
jgi:hypothetical protein